MIVDTLLIPTDGSDSAEHAARRGFDLAAALDATVHVLSVADSSIATGAGYAGDSPSIRERLRTTANARATSLRDEATERGLDATAAVREGIPANEIVEYAAEREIDAIAIGTVGRGGISRAIVGSVTDKVVRTASVPVVTIDPDAATEDRTWTVGSILLPIDGSDTAATAARFGFELATQLDATVHLLSVVDDEQRRLLSSLSRETTDPSESLREQADHTVNSLAEDAREHEIEPVTAVRGGRPAGEIVDYADSQSVDLIVMGTAGRGGFERAVLGSVTDDVVRTSAVPVVTIRPTDLGLDR